MDVTADADVMADLVATAVLACPHVVGLRSAPTSGVGAEVATYLPGRRVDGVRVRESAVAVRVVGWFGANMAELASEVRCAVKAVVPTAETVDVFIDDLLVPPDRMRPTRTADDALILALAGRRSPAFTDRRTSPSAGAAPLDARLGAGSARQGQDAGIPADRHAAPGDPARGDSASGAER